VTFRPLDVVVLQTDQPAQGLKRGDLGAVVDVYAPDAIDVEFVTASGRTCALVTLKARTFVKSRTMTLSQYDPRAAMPNRRLQPTRCVEDVGRRG
jgi:hypothetical protein